jgi:stress-induced morphogen
MPDADVVVTDMTGTMDHYDIRVRSNAFSGKSLLDQHRMVYAALEAARQDGRIHALQLKTEVPSA